MRMAISLVVIFQVYFQDFAFFGVNLKR